MKNGYACTDGTTAWCPASEICRPGGNFSKLDSDKGCGARSLGLLKELLDAALAM